MHGYDVVGSDEKRVGRAVGTRGDFLVVERGLLRKVRHALPLAFAHVDDAARVVRLTVSKQILADSPPVGDELDERALAAHYGLAAGDAAPPAEGYGESVADDPALGPQADAAAAGIDEAEARRAATRERLHPAGGEELPESPALLGERYKHLR